LAAAAIPPVVRCGIPLILEDAGISVGNDHTAPRHFP
jgi:hypothetical protein